MRFHAKCLLFLLAAACAFEVVAAAKTTTTNNGRSLESGQSSGLAAANNLKYQGGRHANNNVRGLGRKDQRIARSLKEKNDKKESDDKQPKDKVIEEDIIAQSKLCVGADCEKDEVFGDEAIKVKESSPHILFQDTSASDWEITINDGDRSNFAITDVDNGGSVPFRIEAGAPEKSLYVDDQGNIGIGTGTPSVEIHALDGDSPTLRLQQDGSSGFTPQTWDVAGNEVNFFVRDVTNASNLPFRIKPGAPTDSINVSSDGKIGLGVDNADTKLHLEVGDGEDAIITLERTGSDTFKWQVGSTSDASGDFVVSDAEGSKTPLKIEKGAPDDAVFVSNNGDVGINTATPSTKLDVDGDVTITGTLNGCTLPTSGTSCIWPGTRREMLVSEDSRALKEALARIEGLEAREGLLSNALQRIKTLEDEISCLKKEKS